MPNRPTTKRTRGAYSTISSLRNSERRVATNCNQTSLMVADKLIPDTFHERFLPELLLSAPSPARTQAIAYSLADKQLNNSRSPYHTSSIASKRPFNNWH